MPCGGILSFVGIFLTMYSWSSAHFQSNAFVAIVTYLNGMSIYLMIVQNIYYIWDRKVFVFLVLEQIIAFYHM